MSNHEQILRVSKRLRGIHRRGKMKLSLKEYARIAAATVTPAERKADPMDLDRKGALTTSALAWHWLHDRGMAAS